jgi:hypothetical protein
VNISARIPFVGNNNLTAIHKMRMGLVVQPHSPIKNGWSGYRHIVGTGDGRGGEVPLVGVRRFPLCDTRRTGVRRPIHVELGRACGRPSSFPYTYSYKSD